MQSDSPLFVIIHAYFDGSGYEVIGVTDDKLVAEAWQLAGVVHGVCETHAFPVTLNKLRRDYKPMENT